MPAPLDILIVDDEPTIRRTLAVALEVEGHRAAVAATAADALALARGRAFDLALLDLRLGSASGLDVLPALLADSPWMKVVLMTAHATVATAVEAMRRGAADYLAKPFTPAEVAAVVGRVARLRGLEREVEALRGTAGGGAADPLLESRSPEMRRAVELARQVASADATVLLTGESGTGKNVLARAVHAWSRRATGPFGVVSCPSLSGELLEGELFGHARGAFTGAARDNPGRVAAADGGTLLLDEIGDLPPALQPKLLRFLQDKQYERLGDPRTRTADVRLVCATNVDLDAAVAAGRFRQDLLYRVNVFPIELPPLRRRREDVPDLARRLLAEVSPRRPLVLTDGAAAALASRDWPGNVRELRNALERAAILARGETVGAADLALPGGAATVEPGPERLTLAEVEERHVRRVLANEPSLESAAATLGIDPATLYRKRKRYGV